MNPQFNKGVKTLSTAVTKAQEQLREANELLNKYTHEKLEQLTEDIETKQAQLSNLETEFKEKYRQANVDLRIRIQEDKVRACEQFANGAGMRFISNEEYHNLVADSNQAEDNAQQAVAEEKKRNAIEKASALKNAEMQHKLDTAQMEAELKQTKSTLAFYEAQNAELRAQLDSANENMVKIAEAQPSITVSGK